MRILRIVVLKIDRDIINDIVAWITIGVFDKTGKQTMSLLVNGSCLVQNLDIREGMELQLIPTGLVRGVKS